MHIPDPPLSLDPNGGFEFIWFVKVVHSYA